LHSFPTRRSSDLILFSETNIRIRAENLLMFLIKLLVMKWTEVRAQQKKRFTPDPHCFRIFEHLSQVFSLNKQGTANIDSFITAFGQYFAYFYMLVNIVE